MGEKEFEVLETKIKNGLEVTKQDIISLTFTPIMGGSISTVDKILNAINIVKDIKKDYKNDIESILYAFANKFLSGKDLEKVKEELRMTELGKSLIQEGIEKGKDEGKKEKTLEIVKKAIKKGLDNQTIKELTDLDIEEIELIREVLK
ncbi:hypothetical protein Z966_07555 [Clostridium novyi A str. NCTC 538]|uniref:Transposase n=1 Tax=Clostridium novyi (strain NT) TaxID=386415 RepID=A0PZJ9_CLONN|nr:conserved hypothetical protein [Clostridium novyi NT]KEH85345.1 hypothetical protein Z966_07555 [Clostridium novyi A str. NCTC 538]